MRYWKNIDLITLCGLYDDKQSCFSHVTKLLLKLLLKLTPNCFRKTCYMYVYVKYKNYNYTYIYICNLHMEKNEIKWITERCFTCTNTSNNQYLNTICWLQGSKITDLSLKLVSTFKSLLFLYFIILATCKSFDKREYAPKDA